MTAIAKREFHSYFHSMTGYVYVAVMLCFLGIYFTAVNLFSGYPQFSYSLINMQAIFMFATPILTMRSMAEERRSKTDQLLLTAPISLTRVVLGKFFGMVGVFAIPTLICCLCPLIIATTGNAYLASDYAAIFAFFLIGCVYISIGLFISSLTESQVIAAVGTFGALFVLLMWDGIVTLLPSFLGDILAKFSFQTSFMNFTQYNVFDFGGIVLYLSMSAVFLFLTVQTLCRRRWN